jgi:hypothetical protein
MPRRTILIAAALLGATGVFVSIVVWLHLVRPDVSPMVRGISRYAVGPHGYAISVGFAALASAVGIAAGQLNRRLEGGAFKWHAWSLWAAVAGLFVVIVWPLRSPSAGVTEYWLHQGGGAVFFAAAAAGVQAIPQWLSRARTPGVLVTAARTCSLASAVTVVAFFGSVIATGTSLDTIRGVLQRGCFVSFSGSLALLGCGLLVDKPANSRLEPAPRGAAQLSHARR